jgi:hypothetical protein
LSALHCDCHDARDEADEGYYSAGANDDARGALIVGEHVVQSLAHSSRGQGVGRFNL